MRSGVIAILGTAVATLASAGVLPPNSRKTELNSHVDPDDQFGCYCLEKQGKTSIPLQNVTETCCPRPLRHNDGQLCMPLEGDPIVHFLNCCVRMGGGHGFGGDCETVEDIEAGHGDFPPKAAEFPPKATEMPAPIHATPTPMHTAHPEGVNQRDSLMRDEQFNDDDNRTWCECYPGMKAWTRTCCDQVGGRQMLLDYMEGCELESEKGIANFGTCCKSANPSNGMDPVEFFARCQTLDSTNPSSGSASPNPATSAVTVMVSVIETSVEAAPTPTDTASLVGPRRANDDEKHYCWCYPNNKAFTSQCCTEVNGMFYKDKLCLVSLREKEYAFDGCCREVGDHGASDYGACMDIDPEDHSRHPFTTTVTLQAKRGEVTTAPVHKTHTSPYYITHHHVTL